MTDENQPERRALSLEEGVAALRQSREPKAPEPEAAEEPEEQDHAEPDVEDDPDAEPEEVEEDDQPEGEAEEEESEPEDEDEDDDDSTYEVGGVEFTLSELREWQKNGLRQSDYTKKTQEVAELRKQIETDRETFTAERDQVVQQLKAEKAKLQDQLATFAIEQDPEPSPDGLTWEQFTKRKSEWDKRQKKRDEARQAYQALVNDDRQQRVMRETQNLLRHFPDWQKPGVFEQAVERMTNAAKPYGFTPEEVMNGIEDHRLFRILNDLVEMKTVTDKRQKASKTAQEKVGKAVKRLAPGAKPDTKNQPTKAVRQSRDRLKKTGSVEDGIALLRARRAASGST